MLAVSSPPNISLKKLVKSRVLERRASSRERSSYKADFSAFVEEYPIYKETIVLDRLRKVDFERLEKAKEVYVDYMGGCLWPRTLVTGHAAILEAGLFGNTHSDSPCATRSDKHIAAARNAVLEFFDAPSSDYVCIFTANATTALKLIGESFPFNSGSCLVIPADCHNSVNGIRTFAESAGASVEYLESTPYGGFNEEDAKSILNKHRCEALENPSLFVLTGQSNITGIRPSKSILTDAKSSGFATLIDAAALASSTRISLQQIPSADAMVVSFYKMFGYPTGVGALIAKKSFLATLARKWFSGGTVDFVQAPGKLTLHAKDLNARFEEGTLNYGSLSAIAPGLNFLSTYMPYMALRLPALHHYLHTALESLVYPGTQTHLVQVHTKPRHTPLHRYPTASSGSGHSNEEPCSPVQPSNYDPPLSPTRSLKRLFSRRQSTAFPTPPTTPVVDAVPPPFRDSPKSDTSTTANEGQGYVVSCTFYSSSGTIIPLSHVSRLASASGISLRTGCVCNPGGSVALRGRPAQERMDELSKFDDQVELKEICTLMGGLTNAGVVRLSLGLVSNFEDVWRLVCWARSLLDEAKREKDLEKLNHLSSH